MSRIFFISIKPELGDYSTMSIDLAYQRLGKNTGNLLFTNAVWSQLKYDVVESGYSFNPSYVNQNFDYVVIPAANWLFENFDFMFLAVLIEQLTIPVVMIGVGAQAGTEQTIPALTEGTKRLIKAVSERSALVGVRGDFSAEVMDYYGVKNVEVIGCPSLYYGHDGGLKIVKSKFDRVMTGAYRYYFSNEDLSEKMHMQRSLYQFAINEQVDINYQSERPEFDFLLSNRAEDVDPSHLKQAVEYYGCSDEQYLLDFIKNHGKLFTNVDRWISEMRSYDFYIGSRIHGVIATLLSGTPGCLITHDSRTKELAEFAAIPFFPQEEVGDLSMRSVEDIYDSIDFLKFQNSIKLKYIDYIKFLDVNTLPHNLTRVEHSKSSCKSRVL